MNSKVEYEENDVVKWSIKDIDLKNKTICDIGVGSGLSSIYYASKGAKKVIGLEPSRGKGGNINVYDVFISNIKKYRLENIVIPQQIGFLENNYEDNNFDYVFAINALHHVIENSTDKSNFNGLENRLAGAIKEMKRIAKPNGKIVIWDMAFDSIYRFVKIRYKQIDWYLHPTLKMWRNAAREEFDSVSFEYTYFFRIPMSKYIMRNYLSLYFLNPTFKLVLTK